MRQFATEVVTRLTEAGFEALWAGGCVRDELLGIVPKDFDVATSATPEQVVELFGKKKTVPVGVAFGVVMVLGPNRKSGQVEVATFRADGEYLDGRRPEDVRFCSAEEDAKRRDFTINGMFYDPLKSQLIDYVGGQNDLQRRVVRAIGNAEHRFAEDKLRMLRAIRFAATFQFELESETADAVRKLRKDLCQVSVERIAQEVRRMLAHENRSQAVRLMLDTQLANEVFPTMFNEDSSGKDEDLPRRLEKLKAPEYEPSLTMIVANGIPAAFDEPTDAASIVHQECRRLKLSNEETQCCNWLLSSAVACRSAHKRPLHVIKPILQDKRWLLLVDLLQSFEHRAYDSVFLQQYRDQTQSGVLNPDPLIDGTDLQKMGVRPGPDFKRILCAVRNEQLDELTTTRDAALQRVAELKR